jgi:hypothetical protein
MYDDFIEIQQGASKVLEKLLNEHYGNNRSTNNGHVPRDALDTINPSLAAAF